MSKVTVEPPQTFEEYQKFVARTEATKFRAAVLETYLEVYKKEHPDWVTMDKIPTYIGDEETLRTAMKILQEYAFTQFKGELGTALDALSDRVDAYVRMCSKNKKNKETK